MRPSKRVEMWYRSRLLHIVDLLRKEGTAIAGHLKSTWPHVGDETSGKVDREIEAASARFGNIDLSARRWTDVADKLSLTRRSLAEVDDRLAKSVHDSIGVNIRPFLTGHEEVATAMRDAAEANVALIKSIPVEYFDAVRETVQEAFASGLRWEAIVERIEHIGDVTENRAKFIAQDQVSKLNASFNRIRQQQVGIAEYDWSGTLDQRERKSHRDMEGHRCRWDSPPLVDGEHVHPGEAPRCRCVPLPVIHLDEEPADGGQEAEAA